MTTLLVLVAHSMLKKLHSWLFNNNDNSNNHNDNSHDNNSLKNDNQGTKEGLSTHTSTPLSPPPSIIPPASGSIPTDGRGGELEMTSISASPSSSSSFTSSGAGTGSASRPGLGPGSASGPGLALASSSAQTPGLGPPRLGGPRRPSNVSQNLNPLSPGVLDVTMGTPVEVAHMALANR